VLAQLLAVPVAAAAVGAGVGAAHILRTDDTTEVIVTERLVVHREPGKTVTVKGKTVRLPPRVRTKVVTRRVDGKTVYRTVATTTPGRTVTLPAKIVRLPGKVTTISLTGPTRTVVRTSTLERTTTMPGTTVQLPGVTRTETVERETPGRTFTVTTTLPAQTVTNVQTVINTVTEVDTVTEPGETVTVTVTNPKP
jgi:hypothetical protein